MDRSPKICTRVEQMLLYQAGLSLDIDVAVPFLKSKNIAKNCASIQGWRWVVAASQSEAPIDFAWQHALSYSSLSVPVT